MGYDTYYRLEFSSGVFEDYLESAKAISQELHWTLSGECVRRWDEDPDMIKFSRMYPGVTFILVAYGEEQTDIWRVAYKDGKAQHGNTVMYFEEIILPDGTVVPKKEIA